MKPADITELIALAAFWGGSFIFMRLGAGEFGALPLAWLRVAGAALVLLPLLIAHRELDDLRAHWKPILIVGITNSALPFACFACFAYAALTISAGLSSIFNAATPLFGAVIAWLWLKDRLGVPRVIGLVIGCAGVFWLAVGKADGPIAGPVDVQAVASTAATPRAVLACLAASVSYGCAVTFLVPAFAVGWGALFIGERPTAAMLAGCGVILAGTALATGLLPRTRSAAPT